MRHRQTIEDEMKSGRNALSVLTEVFLDVRELLLESSKIKVEEYKARPEVIKSEEPIKKRRRK